jgi:hypothetical protein
VKRLLNLFLLAGLIVALVGCAPAITSGTITAKEHDPESRTLHFIPTKIGNVTVFNYYWIVDDEDWMVTITEGELEATFYIEESEWNDLKIGDHVEFDANTESFDKDTKEKTTDQE